MTTPAEILVASGKITAMHRRIHESLKCRDRSVRDREDWHAACHEFHQQYPRLFFPGGEARWDAFIRGDSAETDTAIAFLEADPYFFRSGYMKEIIWRRLKKPELSTPQRSRLERAALAYLRKPALREFWKMVGFARMRASENFWERVATLTSSPNYNERAKAKWLMLAHANFPVRHWVTLELIRAGREPDCVADMELSVCYAQFLKNAK